MSHCQESIHVCGCVCGCVCVYERERKRKLDREARERKWAEEQKEELEVYIALKYTNEKKISDFTALVTQHQPTVYTTYQQHRLINIITFDDDNVMKQPDHVT